MDQRVQTFTIGDYCNECGNCDTFCPAAGAPYRDKPHFWIDDAGYREARGDAFRLLRNPAGLSLEARLGGRTHRLDVLGDQVLYTSEEVTAHLQVGTWTLLDWKARTELPEGTRVDLAPCATLLALLSAESALPPCNSISE